jgi:hypothetical protein
MPLVIDDRVRETSTVTGTSDATLLGAVTGFQTFSVIGNSNTTYYTISDQAGGNWEVGIGTFSSVGPTLARTTVLSSSAGGTKVSFPAGTKDVFVTYPSEKAVYIDDNGNVQPALGDVNATTVDTTNLEVTNLKAKDGTAAGSIANSTGIVTLASSVLTTTDINGGTIDGTTIGASTASTGRFSDLTDTGLTDTRVIYAGAGGNLVDSTNLTFNGTTLVANDITDSSLTSGRVTFAGAGGNLVDSANLTFDSTNTRLGVGTASPAITTALIGTDAVLIPKGDTAARPTGVSGYLRFNTQTSEFEGHNGTAWSSVGGSAISNDTSTATDLFPTFLSATTGTATSIFTSNSKLLYKPSTGELKASAVVATNGLVINSATASANSTVATGQNAMSVGPFTVNSGVVVTVSSGSRWVIL